MRPPDEKGEAINLGDATFPEVTVTFHLLDLQRRTTRVGKQEGKLLVRPPLYLAEKTSVVAAKDPDRFYTRTLLLALGCPVSIVDGCPDAGTARSLPQAWIASMASGLVLERGTMLVNTLIQ